MLNAKGSNSVSTATIGLWVAGGGRVPNFDFNVGLQPFLQPLVEWCELRESPANTRFRLKKVGAHYVPLGSDAIISQIKNKN
jgi:hypothetical protein